MLNTIIVVVACVGSVIIVAVLGYVVAHAHEGEQRRHAESSEASAAGSTDDLLRDDPLRGTSSDGASRSDETGQESEQPDTDER
ncbi:hypothetical protein [Plantibacter sp. YIM 135249]|uniref:hypothetical protein n=1 Tax=Plantibacter sp. YIM 135249 TaxID=3423918 RepID=UPI003D327FC1